MVVKPVLVEGSIICCFNAACEILLFMLSFAAEPRY